MTAFEMTPVLLFPVFLFAAAWTHFGMMIDLRHVGEPVQWFAPFWRYEKFYRRYAELAPQHGWSLWPYHASWALLGGAALWIPFVSKAINQGPQKPDLTSGVGFLVWAAVIVLAVGIAYVARSRTRERS